MPPIVLTPLAWNALRLGAVAAMAVYASRRRSTPKDADHEQTLDALPEGFAASTHRAEAERGMHAAGRFRRVLRFGRRRPSRSRPRGSGGSGCAVPAEARMRLYSSATSPFVRKVLVVLHETGLIDQVELVPSGGTPVAPGTIPVERNPLGKLPTLERSDGTALYDSRVICRYLDDLGGGRLYPGKPRLWETLTLEATGDGMMEAAVLMIYEVRLAPGGARATRPGSRRSGRRSPARSTRSRRAGCRTSPGRSTPAQIAVGCALGYLDLRHDARSWRAGRPALAAWAARFAERPAMQATRPVA